MKKLLSILAIAAIVGLGLWAAGGIGPAKSATNFPAIGAGEGEAMVLTLNRQYTATLTNVVKFTLPYKAQLLGVSATARASGGTSPTLTVDVMEGGVTVLSAPIAITAGTVAEGTVTDSSLADEALMTVNIAITGTSPTWDDITVVLTVARN